MSEHVLTQPTLVLNKSWRPIGIDTVYDSVKKIFKETCRFIDTDTFEVLDLPTWLERDPVEGFPCIVGVHKSYIVPDVVLLTDYSDMPRSKVRLTRKNVLIRDKYCCQYCGVKVARPQATPHGASKVRKITEYTWDHVKPRSQGGKNSWTNIVTACFRCNMKKNDRTPEQAHMPLLSTPKEPVWSLTWAKSVPRKPATWDKFLSKDVWDDTMYWDVELHE